MGVVFVHQFIHSTTLFVNMYKKVKKSSRRGYWGGYQGRGWWCGQTNSKESDNSFFLAISRLLLITLFYSKLNLDKVNVIYSSILYLIEIDKMSITMVHYYVLIHHVARSVHHVVIIHSLFVCVLSLNQIRTLFQSDVVHYYFYRLYFYMISFFYVCTA